MKKKYFTKEQFLEAKRKRAKIYRQNWTEDQKEKSRARVRKFDERHRQENAEKTRAWRDNDPRRSLLHSAQTRAKRLGLQYNITVQDIKVPKYCPILKIELKRNKTKVGDGSPSLDRIDNRKGYVRGNVRVISYAANRMKSNITKPILRRLNKYVFGQ